MELPFLPAGIKLQATTNDYAGVLRELQRFLATKECDLSFQSLIDFFNRQKELSPSTFKRKRAAIKSALLSWADSDCENLGYRPQIDWFFRTRIQYTKLSSRVRTSIPSGQELKRILKELPARYALILETLILTGLRITECLSLDVSRAKYCGRFYEFSVIGKGRRERILHLDVKFVRRIQKEFSSTGLLFLNSQTGKAVSRQAAQQAFQKVAREVTGRRFHPHMVRHFHVTAMLGLGYSLEDVSRSVGHSSVSVTFDLYNQRALSFESMPDLSALLEDQKDGSLKHLKRANK